MPHEEKEAPIQCKLFNYSLVGANHLYEALSYVWGSRQDLKTISIDKDCLQVTPNLHMALMRLRDRFIERVIWIDAICINQEDIQERSAQVQRMARIYGKANRVIVWLGPEADQSDEAFNAIRAAADRPGCFEGGLFQDAVLSLIERPWFTRVWVSIQYLGMSRIVLKSGPGSSGNGSRSLNSGCLWRIGDEWPYFLLGPSIDANFRRWTRQSTVCLGFNERGHLPRQV